MKNYEANEVMNNMDGDIIEIIEVRNRAHKREADTIRVVRDGQSAKRVFVSGNVVLAAGMDESTKVLLGRVQGTNTLVLSPSRARDAFVIKHATKDAPADAAYYLSSREMARAIAAIGGADVFYAWGENGRIYFEAEKED